MLSVEQVAAMEARCKQATPGPWYETIESNGTRRIYGHLSRGICTLTHPDDVHRRTDARFLTTFSPDTVLALLSDWRVMREAITHQHTAIRSALQFLYDSETGVNGIEEMANALIDQLEATLTPESRKSAEGSR